jgi:tetratricopeptide (TPR) repeat protein
VRSALLSILIALGSVGALAGAGFAGARSQGSQVSSTAPRSVETERELSERWRDCLLIDRPGEVLAEAEKHAAGAPWDGEVLALAARAAFVARGRDEAERWLARTPVAPETTAWIELERARIELESDELPKALALLLNAADERAPKLAAYPDAWLYAGRAWTRLGDPARGAAFLSRFVELAPFDTETPSALHALAQEALSRNDGAAATVHLRRADENARWQSYRRVRVLQVRESPDEPLPRLGLAQLWLQARDAARAKRVLTELLALRPDYATGWFHLGEAERLANALPAALDAYSKALEFDPEHVLARHNRGTIQRLAGRTAEARADYERIVDGPKSTEKTALNTHLALARLLAASNETDAAQKRYARYRELGGTEALAP